MAPAEPNAKPFQLIGDAPVFPEEREGWRGYIEWEKYPEKKKQAADILAKYDFPVPPEFQLEPLPKTNPLLEGVRWKHYHYALGDTLKDMPDISWEHVLKEKSEDMLHVLQFPYNGEPPRKRLVETEITDNKDLFVRNHGGIPEIDPASYYFEVEGLVNNPKKITLAELQDESIFPRMSTTVTLQCSGTRRLEQIHDYPGDGDELINAPWGEGAIGTSRWTGVSLKKVIKYCGGLKDNGKHLEFFGADTYFKKGQVYNYGVSVPSRKMKVNEVMLAWEVNGETLPPIHGGPLRVVVMGYIGARSCKWLTRINVISDPSLAPVQMKEYIYYTPQVGKHNATYSNGFSIQTMPVASAIMTPVDKDVIMHDGKIKLTGWAYSGSGWPERVEVSADGGGVWYQVPYDQLSTKYLHAWRTWEYEIPVDAEGWLEFCVRCWDDALNTQPTFVRSAWNWDLHVTSSCHRVKLYSVNRTKPMTAKRLKLMEEKGVSMLPLTRPMEFDLETEEEYLEEMKKRGGRDPIE
ncbi:molybdopterin binding oxidoreductase [Dothidotthia symphoricarpi CBS 119687]|uniref:Molybdopterin binding oxidoreductase n=1 Tax=Dothidotthia symphoricarpi CBS 119687 TaxID=1392245 RepID=A0A6A5ZW58_9PLEO|nr:molybdopterin binding oxidoreductase [Dothidotthia symphoricarpi CBS 119687]KAF2123526.1 molybdopterin binding oxidoreductase [Dothidotthia symphoricarpi CBS 119687]